MTARLRNAVGATLLGLAAAITAPTASAAMVTGSWDPALTSLGAGQFNGLGWTATINVNVDDSCIRADGSSPIIISVFSTVFNCSNPVPILGLAFSPFTIESAQLAFYGLGDGLLQKVFTLDETRFTPQLLKLGVDSEVLFLSSSTDSDVVSYLGYDFRLRLPGLSPQLRYRNGSEGRFRTATDPITDTQFLLSYEDPTVVVERTRLKVGELVFSRDLPEPGSMALALLALGAAGAAAARRTRRANHAA